MHNSLAKKIIALTTLLCFLAGGLPATPSSYAGDAVLTTPTPLVFDLNHFKIAKSLGGIREKYHGANPGTVLILEDAHAQPDAQKNIEKIIRKLSDRFGVRDVIVEGGAGKGDAFLFRQFPDRKILRETFDDYLGRGELSGSMSAAVFSREALKLSGAEEKRFYLDQITAFLSGLKTQPGLIAQVDREKLRLASQKKKYYSNELLDLNHALELYEKDGALEPHVLADTLGKFARLNPSTRYPILQLLQRELKQASDGSESALRADLGDFLKALQLKAKSPNEFKFLNQARQDFETERSGVLEIAYRLARWTKAKGWKVPLAKSLMRGIREQRQWLEIKGPDFLKQWDAYVEETMQGQLRGAEAAQVYADSKELKFLERLIRFELARKDWNDVSAAAQGLSEWPGLKFGFTKNDFIAQFNFYNLAQKREQIFIKKIKERLRHSSESKTVIFVAGGFHTSGLEDAVKRAGFSYAVITPVFQPVADDGRYEALMRGEVSWRSYFKPVNDRVDLKAAFNQAAVDQLIEKQKTMHAGSRYSFQMAGLKDWRDQLIRAAAKEGRLESAGAYTRWIDRAASSMGTGRVSGSALQAEWKERIESFLTGLKQLVDSHQLTESNLAGLFTAPALSPMGDKPFVAIAISAAMANSEVRMSKALSQEPQAPSEEEISRSEVRTMEQFAGYSDLKPVIQGALNVLSSQYLIPPRELEIFTKVEIASPPAAARNDKAGMSGDLIVVRSPQQALVSLSLREHEVPEAISGVRISEELVRAAKDDPAGQRILARSLARFLDERDAAQGGAENAAMASAIGLRLDLFRFLAETETEREQDLVFYKQHAVIFTNVVGNGLKPFPTEYIQAHAAMRAEAAKLAEAPAYKQIALKDEIRRAIVSEVTRGITTDVLVLREAAVREAQVSAQVEAFKTQGFFNSAAQENPVGFWAYASLDLLRRLVLELTSVVEPLRHQQVSQKTGIAVESISFRLSPWQLRIGDFKEVRLNDNGPTLKSLYEYLTQDVDVPEHLARYTPRDQKIGILLEQLDWNSPPRLFDADRMDEKTEIEGVLRWIDWLAGDVQDSDEKPGHRWVASKMGTEEVEAMPVADLPEANLLTSYFLGTQAKNMEASRLGFFGESSLRFTTGTLSGSSTAFYEKVQFATILRAFRRFPDAAAFAGFKVPEDNDPKRADYGFATVRKIVNNAPTMDKDSKTALAQFKEAIQSDAELSSHILFSDDLKRRASSGLLQMNLAEVHAFKPFLDSLLPSVEKLQAEQNRPALEYGAMDEHTAVSELGVVGLELIGLYQKLSIHERSYGVLAGGRPALFMREGKPMLSVTVDANKNVTAVIFYTTDESGRILYEDHRRVQGTHLFSADLDLEGWLQQEGTIYDQAIVERVFYDEKGLPVFRLSVDPETNRITVADTLGNAKFLTQIASPPTADRNDNSRSANESAPLLIQSFSVQRHGLVSENYVFDSARTAASDWLSSSVEAVRILKEKKPPKTGAKEIIRTPKGGETQVRIIHYEAVAETSALDVLPDAKKPARRNVVTSVEEIKDLEATKDLVGDHYKMLQTDVDYKTATTDAKWWELLDSASGPIDAKEVVKRVFYDVEFYERTADPKDRKKNPYRPLVELDIAEDGLVSRMSSYGYDLAGNKIYEDRHQNKNETDEEPVEIFDATTGFETWQKIPIRERTFLDKDGRKILTVQLDPSNPGRVLAIRRYGKMEIGYPEAVLEKINQRKFDPAWTVENWLDVLQPYEFINSAAASGDAFDQERKKILDSYTVIRGEILDRALFYSAMLRHDEIHVGDEWIGRLEAFVQTFLIQGLRPWIKDLAERPRDLSYSLRRTMNLMEAYGEALGVPSSEWPARAALLKGTEDLHGEIHTELARELWDAEDIFSAAATVQAARADPAAVVSERSTGSFAETLTPVLTHFEGLVSGRRNTHEQILKRLGVLVSQYDGSNFLELRDGSPARLAAEWAVRYAAEVYGVQQASGNFERGAENDAVSLVHSAAADLEIVPAKQFVDAQPNGDINKLAERDNTRASSWNPERFDQPMEQMSEKRGLQDILYEVFTLKGQHGRKSREALAQKLYEDNKALAVGGVMILMLPSNKGLSEEGIEQIEAHYGFKRAEEGIAFNEFEAEYRLKTAASVGPGGDPKQALEMEDKLQSQRFYVLILKKTGEVSADVAQLPKNELAIHTFDVPPGEELGGVNKARVGKEIHLIPKPKISELIKQYSPKNARSAPPIPRSGRAAKRTSLPRARVDHFKSDKDIFVSAAPMLALIRKYRGLLLQAGSGIEEETPRSRIRTLLNRTHTPMLEQDSRDRDKIHKAWTQARDVWFIESQQPSLGQPWPKTKMVQSAENPKYAISLAYEGDTLKAVWVQTLDDRGRVLYSEPRKVLAGSLPANKSYESLKASEGTLYSAEADLDAIFRRWSNIFLPVYETHRDLLSVYPALKEYPGLETTWFTDEAWQSLENLMEQASYDDEFDSLFQPFVENRDFVLSLREKWRKAEKIEIEDAAKLDELRRMARGFRFGNQLWGLVFRRRAAGQPKKSAGARSPYGSSKAEATMHSLTLNANPSFLATQALARYVQHRLAQQNGPMVVGDLAAGSGALAKALDQLGIAPSPELSFVELDMAPEILRQARPQSFEAVRGSHYHAVVGSVTAMPRNEGFEDDRFDLLSASFILDHLDQEDSRAMLAEVNRTLSVGGGFVTALPQSWRLSAKYFEALNLLGFDVVVAPMRAAHQASEAWIDEIKASYADTPFGNEIAEAVRRMKEKQFSILILSKRADFINDLHGKLQEVPATLFELEKTDTGQRGKTTGEHPYDFSEEARTRWIEISRWMFQDAGLGSMNTYDPSAKTVTRVEALEIFPEINSENALEHLYALRFLFSSRQEDGNAYELIADFHTYWDETLGIKSFRQEDVEKLAAFYRRGPPKQSYSAHFLSWAAMMEKLKSRAGYFFELNRDRGETYEHSKRNDALQIEIRELMRRMESAREIFSQAELGTDLAIAKDQRDRFGFHAQFSVLHGAAQQATSSIAALQEELWSPQHLAGLIWFIESIHKPGDNTLARWLRDPLELPGVGGARSEMRTAEEEAFDPDTANLETMLRNALEDPNLKDRVLPVALRMAAAVQKKERAKARGVKPKPVATSGTGAPSIVDPLAATLARLTQIVGPQFEAEWKKNFGFPRELPEDPIEATNLLSDYELWTITEDELKEAGRLARTWLSATSEEETVAQEVEAWLSFTKEDPLQRQFTNRIYAFYAQLRMEAERSPGVPMERVHRLLNRQGIMSAGVGSTGSSAAAQQEVLLVQLHVLQGAVADKNLPLGGRMQLMDLLEHNAWELIKLIAADQLNEISDKSPLKNRSLTYKGFPQEAVTNTAKVAAVLKFFNGKTKPTQLNLKEIRKLLDGLNLSELELCLIGRVEIPSLQTADMHRALVGEVVRAAMARKGSAMMNLARIFSLVVVSQDAGLQGHVLTPLLDQFNTQMQSEPFQREFLEMIEQDSQILITFAYGFSKMMALQPEAVEQGRIAVSLFDSGGDQKLRQIFEKLVRRSLQEQDPHKLRSVLVFMVTLLKRVEKDGGQAAKPAQDLRNFSYKLRNELLQRYLTDAEPYQFIYLVESDSENLEPLTRDLGGLAYRLSKTSAAPAEVLARARHYLDGILVIYGRALLPAEQQRLQRVFEDEVQGVAVPDDPLAAVRYLADKQLWQISSDELEHAEALVKAWIETTGGTEDERFDEIKRWTREGAEEAGPAGLRELNRILVIKTKYRDYFFRAGAHARAQPKMEAWVEERLPSKQPQPALGRILLEWQMLVQALDDSDLSFGEREKFLVDALRIEKEHGDLNHIVANSVKEVPEHSPLHYFVKDFMNIEIDAGGIAKVKAVLNILERSQLPTRKQLAAEYRNMTSHELLTLLHNRQSLAVGVYGGQTAQRDALLLESVLEALTTRPEPMLELTGLMAVLANSTDPWFKGAVLQPVWNRFIQLLATESARAEWIKLFRNNHYNSNFWGVGLSKILPTSPFQEGGAMEKVLREEFALAFREGDPRLVHSFTRFTLAFLTEAAKDSAAQPPAAVQDARQSFARAQDVILMSYLLSGDGHFAEPLSNDDLEGTVIRLGRFVERLSRGHPELIAQIQRRALFYIDFWARIIPGAVRSKLIRLFETPPLPEAPLETAAFLAQKAAEGQKIWTVTPADHEYVAERIQAYYDTPAADTTARDLILSELKTWVDVQDDPWGHESLSRRYLVIVTEITLGAKNVGTADGAARELREIFITYQKQAFSPFGDPEFDKPHKRVLEMHLLAEAQADPQFSGDFEQQLLRNTLWNRHSDADNTGRAFHESLTGVDPQSPLKAYEPIVTARGDYDDAKIKQALEVSDPNKQAEKITQIALRAGPSLRQHGLSGAVLQREVSVLVDRSREEIQRDQQRFLEGLTHQERLEFLKRWPPLLSSRVTAAAKETQTEIMTQMLAQAAGSVQEVLELMGVVFAMKNPLFYNQAAHHFMTRLEEFLRETPHQQDFARLLVSNAARPVWVAELLTEYSEKTNHSVYMSEGTEHSALRVTLKTLVQSEDARISSAAFHLMSHLSVNGEPFEMESRELLWEVMDSKPFEFFLLRHSARIADQIVTVLGERVHAAEIGQKETLRQEALRALNFIAALHAYQDPDITKMLAAFNAQAEGEKPNLRGVLPMALSPGQASWVPAMLESMEQPLWNLPDEDLEAMKGWIQKMFDPAVSLTERSQAKSHLTLFLEDASIEHFRSFSRSVVANELVAEHARTHSGLIFDALTTSINFELTTRTRGAVELLQHILLRMQAARDAAHLSLPIRRQITTGLMDYLASDVVKQYWFNSEVQAFLKTLPDDSPLAALRLLDTAANVPALSWGAIPEYANVTELMQAVSAEGADAFYATRATDILNALNTLLADPAQKEEFKNLIRDHISAKAPLMQLIQQLHSAGFLGDENSTFAHLGQTLDEMLTGPDLFMAVSALRILTVYPSGLADRAAHEFLLGRAVKLAQSGRPFYETGGLMMLLTLPLSDARQSRVQNASDFLRALLRTLILIRESDLSIPLPDLDEMTREISVLAWSLSASEADLRAALEVSGAEPLTNNRFKKILEEDAAREKTASGTLHQKLWSWTPIERDKITGYVDTMLGAAKESDRKKAMGDLEAYLAEPVSKFQILSRKQLFFAIFFQRSLARDYEYQALLEAEAFLNKQVKAQTINNFDEGAQYLQMMVEALQDNSLAFADRVDFAHSLVPMWQSLLDNANSETEAFFRAVPDNVPLALFKIRDIDETAPLGQMVPGGISLPPLVTLRDYVRFVSPPEMSFVRQTHAVELLTQLEVLLSSTGGRDEFKAILSRSWQAVTMVRDLLDNIAVLEILRSFGNLQAVLSEMLQGQDPLSIKIALLTLTAYSRRLSSFDPKEGDAFLLQQASHLLGGSRPFEDYATLLKVNADRGETKERTFVIQTQSLESELKRLLERKRNGEDLPVPSLDTMTRFLLFAAGHYGVSEQDMTQTLQVREGEPLRNNRLKALLDAAGIDTAPPSAASAIERSPLFAIYQANLTEIMGQKLWDLSASDRVLITENLEEVVRELANVTSSHPAVQKLNDFITRSPDQNTADARKIFSDMTFEHLLRQNDMPIRKLQQVFEAVPNFSTRQEMGDNVQGLLKRLKFYKEVMDDPNLQFPQKSIAATMFYSCYFELYAKLGTDFGRLDERNDFIKLPEFQQLMDSGSVAIGGAFDGVDQSGVRQFLTALYTEHDQPNPDESPEILTSWVKQLNDFLVSPPARQAFMQIVSLEPMLGLLVNERMNRYFEKNPARLAEPETQFFRETLQDELLSPSFQLSTQAVQYYASMGLAPWVRTESGALDPAVSQFLRDTLQYLIIHYDFDFTSISKAVRILLDILVRPEGPTKTSEAAFEELVQQVETWLGAALQRRPENAAYYRENVKIALRRFMQVWSFFPGAPYTELLRIFGVSSGGDIFTDNRWLRVVDEFPVPPETAAAASGDATVPAILAAVEKFKGQKLWNLTDEEKSKLQRLAEALVNSTTVTNAGALPREYTDYVNQVSGIPRLARMVYALSEIERAIAAQSLSMSEFKKKMDAVYLAVREIAKHGFPKTTEFFVAGMKMMHEFSEDPEFQGTGYAALGIAWEFYREIFYRLNPKTALAPEVDKLGVLTNRWFVPPGIDRGSLSFGDPLIQVQSISQWILYVLYHPSTTTDEALQFLRLGNRLLAAPEARTALVDALSVSSFFAIGLKARIAKVTATWDLDNAEFENLRAAFLEAADSGNFHALQEVKGISLQTDMAGSDQKNRDLFMTQFFIHLAPRPFENLPAWVFLVYRDFPKPDDEAARKAEFDALVAHFSRQFTEASTRGGVVKEKIDRAVWLLVRVAATLDIPYRDLQRALGVPTQTFDVYDDNVFTRLAVEAAEASAEAFSKRLTELKEEKMWDLSASDREFIAQSLETLITTPEVVTPSHSVAVALHEFVAAAPDKKTANARKIYWEMIFEQKLREKNLTPQRVSELNSVGLKINAFDESVDTTPEMMERLKLYKEVLADPQWALPEKQNIGFLFYATFFTLFKRLAVDLGGEAQRAAFIARPEFSEILMMSPSPGAPPSAEFQQRLGQTLAEAYGSGVAVPVSVTVQKINALLAAPENRQALMRLSASDPVRVSAVISFLADYFKDNTAKLQAPENQNIRELLLEGLLNPAPQEMVSAVAQFYLGVVAWPRTPSGENSAEAEKFLLGTLSELITRSDFDMAKVSMFFKLIFDIFVRKETPDQFNPDAFNAVVNRFESLLRTALAAQPGKADVYRKNIEVSVRRFIHVWAAFPGLAAPQLLQIFNVPAGADIYQDNIFLQALNAAPGNQGTGSSGSRSSEMEVEQAQRIVREAPQHPLWQMNQATYEEIQLAVSLMFETKGVDELEAVYQEFQQMIFPAGLSKEQEMSRKLMAFLIFYDLRYRYVDKTQEAVMRRTAEIFQPIAVWLDGVGRMPEEATKEQLLLEAVRDSVGLFNPQQQVLLQGLQRRRLMILMGAGLQAKPKFIVQDLLNELPQDHAFSFFRDDFENVLNYRLSPDDTAELVQLRDQQDWEGLVKFSDRSAVHRVAVLKFLLEPEGNLSKSREDLIRRIKAKMGSIEEWIVFYEYARTFAATDRQVGAFEGAVEQFVKILENPEQLQRFNRLVLGYHQLPWVVNEILIVGLGSGNSRASLPQLENILLSAIAQSDVLILPMLTFMKNLAAQAAPQGIIFPKQAFNEVLRKVAQAKLAAANDDLSQTYMLFVRISEHFEDEAHWDEQTEAMLESIIRDADIDKREKLVAGIERHYQATYFSGHPDNEALFKILEVQDGDIHNNRFRRAAGFQRSELRQFSPLELLRQRTELPYTGQKTSNFQLQKLIDQTAGYLVAGRLPPPRHLKRLVRLAGTDLPTLEQRLRYFSNHPRRLATLGLRLPEWNDPIFAAQFREALDNLRTRGVVAKSDSGADVVRIFTSMPQTDALIAAMEKNPALNVYGIWQPEAFVGAGSKPARIDEIRKMRAQAKLIESEVNRALGALDTRARFKLVVPESQWKLERLITEAPSVLAGLKGRRDPSVITNRVVVVYDSESELDVEAVSEHQSLSHRIPAADRNRFAKEYLLYESAAEISQDVLSQLYRVFIQGERHYSFQDDRISADLLSAFIGMEHLIAQQFASAA